MSARPAMRARYLRSSAGSSTASPARANSSSACSLQPALRWQRQRQRHAPPPRNCSMRSSQTEKPTPGIGFLRAEQRQQPVVAAAADQRPRRPGNGDLEDQAGIIIERPAEGGVVVDRADRQTVTGDRLGARRKQVERAAELQPRALGEGRQRIGRPVERHVDGEEQSSARRSAESGRRTRLQLGLLQQAPCDLVRRAAAAEREAGLFHRLLQCVRPASRDRRLPVGSVVADRSVGSRPREVGQRRRQATPARRRRAPAASASRAAGRAPPAPPRTPPGRRASPQASCRATPARAAPRASATERASAAAVSVSPRSSMPAWKNSLPPSRRWRNTSPR